jgi:hypothetical protein
VKSFKNAEGETIQYYDARNFPARSNDALAQVVEKKYHDEPIFERIIKEKTDDKKLVEDYTEARV